MILITLLELDKYVNRTDFALFLSIFAIIVIVVIGYTLSGVISKLKDKGIL